MFTDLLTVNTALEYIARKRLMPTALSTSGLAQLSAQVRERALFSARQTRVDALATYAEQLQKLLSGTTDRASARLELRDYYQSIGHVPENEEDLTDHASGARINLVLDTNTQMAQGYGYLEAGNTDESLELYPCSELVRGEERRVTRGYKVVKGHLERDPDNSWPARWKAAAEQSGDTDALACLQTHRRMIARKDSPIWEALSEFGQPYPPFAFNSGMILQDVERDEAVKLGVIDELAVIEPRNLDFSLAS